MSRDANFQFKQGYDYGLYGLPPTVAPKTPWESKEYLMGVRAGEVEYGIQRARENRDFEDAELDKDAAWVRSRRLEWEASQ